jgi:hypothetical protein
MISHHPFRFEWVDCCASIILYSWFTYRCALLNIIILIIISHYSCKCVNLLMLRSCAFTIFNHLCAITNIMISIILSYYTRFVNVIDVLLVVQLCCSWFAYCRAVIIKTILIISHYCFRFLNFLMLCACCKIILFAIFIQLCEAQRRESCKECYRRDGCGEGPSGGLW